MDNVQPLSKAVRNSLRTGVILFDLTRVVEELVFNSLDSGATKVSIFLGIGTCYVKVVDNGSGISRDGLVLLGERYVTSKRHQISDGNTGYQSLGFRGEALASLSDVSLLEIVTKIFGRPNGYRKVIKGSKCLYLGIDDTGKDVGTTVVVRDLFYNQPVRRKYLQSSPKKVLHLVRKCVLRIALVHSQVSFRVVDTERQVEILCTHPSSLLSLLMSSFGMEDDGNLQELDVSDGVLKLSGYVSHPCNRFPKKAFQYVCIHQIKFVSAIYYTLHQRHNVLFSCLDTQRENNSFKRKRSRSHLCPTYIVNLRCPPALCDFSFEPSKTLVQFKDWIPILGFIEKAVQQHWGELIVCGQAMSATNETDVILGDDMWKEENVMPSSVHGEPYSDVTRVRIDLSDTDVVPEFYARGVGTRSDYPRNSCCFQSSCDTFFEDMPPTFNETDPLVLTPHSYSVSPEDYFVSDKFITGGTLSFNLNEFPGTLRLPFLQNCFSKRSSSQDPFAIEDEFEFLTNGFEAKRRQLCDEVSIDVVDGYDEGFSLHDSLDFDLIHGDSSRSLSLHGFKACSDDIDSVSKSFQATSWGDEHLLSDVDYESPELGREACSNQMDSRPSKVDNEFFEPQEAYGEISFGHAVACGRDPNCLLFNLSSDDKYAAQDECSVLFRDVEQEHVLEEQLRRPHSAPPFCKQKKTFICLNQSSTVKEKLSSRIFSDGLNSPDMLVSLVDAGSKWRHGYQQKTNNDACDPGKSHRILDLYMGFLHPTGGPLVPENLKRICLRDAKVLTQVDKKFIPVVAGGVLSVIDQHAADERIRLEELHQKVLLGHARSVTYLDAEQELVLPEMHYQLLHNYSKQIRYWGWICNIQQGNFQKNLNILHCKAPVASLIAVPCILGVKLTDGDLIEFLQQLVDTDGSSTIPPSVHHVLNVKACRGAIMFGDALLPSECGLLVEELGKTSLCFQCAHGRPTTAPLVCLAELHRQIAKLRSEEDESARLAWHGLARQEISLDRAMHRLDVATR